jgi:hypothetical protein
MCFFRNRIAVLFATLLATKSAAWAAAPLAYKWSVEYLIDNSQLVFGRSQEVYPRANRGLAISSDGNYLYAAYNQSFNSGGPLRPRDSRMTDTGEVRKIDLRVADYEDATRIVLPYHRAKAIAVDDQNRVYLAEANKIEVYDADLKNVLITLPADTCDGVAVTREAGHRARCRGTSPFPYRYPVREQRRTWHPCRIRRQRRDENPRRNELARGCGRSQGENLDRGRRCQ